MKTYLYEYENIHREPIFKDCQCRCQRLSVNALIVILIITCVVTFNLQIVSLFNNENEDEFEVLQCLPHVDIKFADNYTQAQLVDRLWKNWLKNPSSQGRLLYNQRQEKDFVAVILPLHWSDNLIALSQYVNHSTLYQKLHNSVNIVLLGTDDENLDNFLLKIIKRFQFEIDLGYIRLIQPSLRFLEDKTVDYNINSIDSLSLNTSDRNLVIKTVLSLQYIQDLILSTSEHFMLVDAHYEIAPQFLRYIEKHIKKENKRMVTWSVLEFGSYEVAEDDKDVSLEHINGWLLKSEDVTKLSFYLERLSHLDVTIIEVMQLFLKAVSQKRRNIIHPSLFRPVGISEMLIAEGFSGDKRWKGDDPQGVVLTNMQSVGRHGADFIYGRDYGYFRAASPQIGDWIGIVFDRDDVALSKVAVETGNSLGELYLKGGIIEASPRLLKLDASQHVLTCADFVFIGAITADTHYVEYDRLDKKLWGRKTKCLRVTVTEVFEKGEENINTAQYRTNSTQIDGDSDVIFAQVAVFT